MTDEVNTLDVQKEEHQNKVNTLDVQKEELVQNELKLPLSNNH